MAWWTPEMGSVRFQTESNRVEPIQNRFGLQFLKSRPVRFGLQFLKSRPVRFGLNRSEMLVGWIRFGSCFTSKCNCSALASKKIISRLLVLCPTLLADVTRWWSDLIVFPFDQNEKKNTTHVVQNGSETVLSRCYHDRSVTPFSSPFFAVFYALSQR